MCVHFSFHTEQYDSSTHHRPQPQHPQPDLVGDSGAECSTVGKGGRRSRRHQGGRGGDQKGRADGSHGNSGQDEFQRGSARETREDVPPDRYLLTPCEKQPPMPQPGVSDPLPKSTSACARPPATTSGVLFCMYMHVWVCARCSFLAVYVLDMHVLCTCVTLRILYMYIHHT